MTYGENAGVIREELTALLRYHRIQQRLGGTGSHTIPATTTPAEREQMGRTIRRYRHATLTWCARALEAISPKNDVGPGTSATRTPVEQLRYQLDRTTAASGETFIREPTSLVDLLATEHEFELVGRWQRIARAAALGEHDFSADVNLGDLTTEQARTVAKDAADVVRGLVILDRRYLNIPGWKFLVNPIRLNQAAEQVSQQIGQQAQDPGVDARGWRPPATVVTTPAPRGVAGAVQAQHNLLLELTHPPNALNLRRVLHAQAEGSHAAVRIAADAAPELVHPFGERAQVYRTLVQQSRDLGGLLGAGGPAVAESQNAVTRLQRVSAREPDQTAALHELRRLFTSTDARIATTIEHGLQEQLYFVSVKVPRLMDQNLNGVFQPRQHWMPVTSPEQFGLLPTLRERLKPTALAPAQVPPQAAHRRHAYEVTLNRQPGQLPSR